MGLLGLVEPDWLETLSVVDEHEVDYIDYVAQVGAGGREIKWVGRPGRVCSIARQGKSV